MNLVVVLALTLTAGQSATGPASNFDTLREGATEVESLRRTVTTLVGLCDVGDPNEQRDCKRGLAKKAKTLRQQGDVYLYLGPQERGLRFEWRDGGVSLRPVGGSQGVPPSGMPFPG